MTFILPVRVFLSGLKGRTEKGWTTQSVDKKGGHMENPKITQKTQKNRKIYYFYLSAILLFFFNFTNFKRAFFSHLFSGPFPCPLFRTRPFEAHCYGQKIQTNKILSPVLYEMFPLCNPISKDESLFFNLMKFIF